MKNQALFSSKDRSKKLKCHLLQFLYGTLRVKKKNKEHSKTIRGGGGEGGGEGGGRQDYVDKPADVRLLFNQKS